MDRTQTSRVVRLRQRGLGWVLGAVFCAGIWSSHAAADELTPPPIAADTSSMPSPDYPACQSGLRLSTVLFDPNQPDRSFVVFNAGRAMRRGARVSNFQIVRIERGGVILSSAAQHCSLRLRSPAKREQQVISAAAVRSALQARTLARARQAAQAALVTPTTPVNDSLARNDNPQPHTN